MYRAHNCEEYSKKRDFLAGFYVFCVDTTRIYVLSFIRRKIFTYFFEKNFRGFAFKSHLLYEGEKHPYNIEKEDDLCVYIITKTALGGVCVLAQEFLVTNNAHSAIGHYALPNNKIIFKEK